MALYNENRNPAVESDADYGYRLPPKEMAAIATAFPVPDISLDPTRSKMALLQREALLSLEQLSRSELRLAGLRFSPDTNGPSRMLYYKTIQLQSLAPGSGPAVTLSGLPPEAQIANPQWSPDGRYLAFSNTTGQGINLWVADTHTGEAFQVSEVLLNEIFTSGFVWHPDSKSLLCRLVPPNRPQPPEKPAIPYSPNIQETQGKKAPGRTYQDLLKNPFDEWLFAYYATSCLARIGIDGKMTQLGEEGLYLGARPSPDGQYILVDQLKPPFSYLVPFPRFPRQVEVWDSAGRPVFRVADLPLADDVPIAMDAVRRGRRLCGWRADADATLYWVEAADQGDPAVESEVRDRLFTLAAPFTEAPVLLAELNLRYSHVHWGSDDLALVYERWWKTRREKVWRLSPAHPEKGARLVFDRSFEDAYGDPGHPLLQPTSGGTRVLMTDTGGTNIFLVGRGSSPEGDRPFLDRFDIEQKKSVRLWRSEPPYYEYVITILDQAGELLLTSRENVEEPANYYLRNLKSGTLVALTSFPHPYPMLKGITKEIIQYRREDGVMLSATLYLPPGYKPGDGPLPMLLWAYPREYKSADAAGQLTDSPYRFDRIGPTSPLSLLTQGYAILDNPAMPIIGEGEAQPNDNYVAQLKASAEAAVAEVVKRGVADPKRIAVGGHSYGAFMTANLLAHTDLFCAGIARSGAYNRTLTPFGFQAEERTLWEAPDVYMAMSPYMHLQNINAPLLLIHGEADNNAGTHLMQSERFYHALQGHGKPARLVILPHESHGYQARESVLHVLWEMHRWLEIHAKGMNGG